MEAIKSPNSAKPSALAKPVPGDDEAAAVSKFMQTYKAPENTQGDSESQAVQQFMQSQQPASVSAEPQPGMAMQALNMTGRVLDAPGGLIRTGLAEVAGMAAGKNIVTEADLNNALKGKAPNSAEYLRRLGVPEGGSLNLPGFGKVTVRGATGLATDIATDPLTAIAKMIKGAPYLAKILNLPGKGTEALGEAVYRSALSNVDSKMAEEGQGAISKLLIENGAPIGGMTKLAEKVNAITSTMGKLRQGLYDKAINLGVAIDTSSPMKNAELVLADMRSNPPLRPAADKFEEVLNAYKGEGLVSIDKMAKWKTSIYDVVAENSGGKLKVFTERFRAGLAADFRQSIMDAGNKAEKGLGDSINAINDKWGLLLDAADPMTAEALRATGSLGKFINETISAMGGLKSTVIKKGYNLATSPAASTAVGKALMAVGHTDLMNRTARQTISGATRSEQPPAAVDMTQAAQPTGASPEEVMQHMQDGR